MRRLNGAAPFGKASRLWQGRRSVNRANAAKPVNQVYLPYSIFSPFGFNGRYVYGRISVNF